MNQNEPKTSKLQMVSLRDSISHEVHKAILKVIAKYYLEELVADGKLIPQEEITKELDRRFVCIMNKKSWK